MDIDIVGGISFQIDFSQPLYEQILNQIRSAIVKGEIGLGEKIPSVRELAQGLHINPNTVMRAYQELERDGLTEKRRGQGTFVTTSSSKVETFRLEVAKEHIHTFLTQMENLGLSWNQIKTYINQMVDGEIGGEER
ncbi:MAG: GntR family transcriptional regulator [Tuberibacillus sp.]